MYYFIYLFRPSLLIFYYFIKCFVFMYCIILLRELLLHTNICGVYREASAKENNRNGRILCH